MATREEAKGEGEAGEAGREGGRRGGRECKRWSVTMRCPTTLTLDVAINIIRDWVRHITIG